MMYARRAVGNRKEHFGIIEEFFQLSPKRKAALSEQLFSENSVIFQRSVRSVWPNASVKDVKKLRNFLVLLRHDQKNAMSKAVH